LGEVVVFLCRDACGLWRIFLGDLSARCGPRLQADDFYLSFFSCVDAGVALGPLLCLRRIAWSLGNQFFLFHVCRHIRSLIGSFYLELGVFYIVQVFSRLLCDWVNFACLGLVRNLFWIFSSVNRPQPILDHVPNLVADRWRLFLTRRNLLFLIRHCPFWYHWRRLGAPLLLRYFTFSGNRL
jgi:hypothetical protein